MISLPSTRSVNANGIRLAYAEWPRPAGPGNESAPAIICLPHLTGHKGSFGPLAERLAPDWRVYALDFRGRGETDRAADGYGFAYHVRDPNAAGCYIAFDERGSTRRYPIGL